MKARLAFFVAGLSLATAGSAFAASARRVVVAGPDDDAIAARAQKELTALGFETTRVGALDGCARSAVVVAASDSAAIAVACSDGDQVGIWVNESGTLRLRDVVVAREEGDRGRETTAVRAAEVTRASIAMLAEHEEAARTAPPPPSPPPQPGWERLDGPSPKPTPPKARPDRAPLFAASAGMSALLGVDASAGAFSAQVQVGVLRHVVAAARLEYPFEQPDLSGITNVRVAPAFAGAGVELPLFAPTSFVIPRLGGGVGVVWIRATKPPSTSFDRSGLFVGTISEGTDSVASPAGYVSAGLSMRIYRPLRLAVDGILGATTSRLVTRDQGVAVAYWGQPFGALALRVELLFQ